MDFRVTGVQTGYSFVCLHMDNVSVSWHSLKLTDSYANRLYTLPSKLWDNATSILLLGIAGTNVVCFGIVQLIDNVRDLVQYASYAELHQNSAKIIPYKEFSQEELIAEFRTW